MLLKLNNVLASTHIAPPYHAELLIKLLVPVKCSELANAQIAPALFLLLALFSRKEVFPVNVRLLLRVVIPHPSLNSHWMTHTHTGYV